MRPRVRSALLWGVVSLLAYLVLLQGYRLLVGPLALDAPTTAAVAVGLGVLVAAVTYVTEGRLAAKGRT